MLAVTQGTQALVDLEDDAPEVLFEHIPGSPVPFWSMVRMKFSVALTGLDLAYPQMKAAPSQSVNPLALLATAFAPSRWDVRALRRQSDVLYITGGGTTYPTPAGLRNWLVGDFADAYADRSAILQWEPLPSPAGRPAFRPTHTLERLVTRSAAYGRLRPVSGEAEAAIRRLVPELARRLDARLTDAHITWVTDQALYAERLRPSIEHGFSRMLDRTRPRLVVMEDASYGAWASLIALTKARGIHVAEPQHGWVGPAHAAYNFGAAMSEPGLRATLPDELLGFGEYWAEGLRYPGPITSIGKPRLEAQAAEARPVAERPREVLWASSTTTPDEVSDMVLALRDSLGDGWAVRFRPHPIERPTLASIYPKLFGAPGVIIDDRGDVAESLAQVRAVVGVASTVLFEALPFGIPVFALESSSAPYYVGDLFGPLLSGRTGIQRVVDAVAGDGRRNPQTWAPATPVERLWKPDSIRNFRAWAESRLGS